ncbi:unnamed protein product [Hymenolepis diminuta]|uniref:Mediator complex subunit 10 n=1 Tax=Hymenolepis diminuta TaxID=6216 RepID=A0A0R3SZH7_HYMDI|nr:unnamed protein product [Hymenolepis diminuta]VUZ43957.1 unnamed protein product [Hymenolepis diminuta]
MSSQPATKQTKPDMDLIVKGLELLAKNLFTEVEKCLDTCLSGDEDKWQPAVPLRPEFAHFLTKLREAVKNFSDFNDYVRERLYSSNVPSEKIAAALREEPELLKTFIRAVGEVTAYLEGLLVE